MFAKYVPLSVRAAEKQVHATGNALMIVEVAVIVLEKSSVPLETLCGRYQGVRLASLYPKIRVWEPAHSPPGGTGPVPQKVNSRAI